MPAQVAFYRARYGVLKDKLIAWLTRSAFSHCELVLDGQRVCKVDPAGVRVEPLAAPYDARWTLVPLEGLDPNQQIALEHWVAARVGSPYDWLGAFRFVLPLLPQSRKAWFCSEFVTRALQHVGFLERLRSWRISPGRLHRILTSR